MGKRERMTEMTELYEYVLNWLSENGIECAEDIFQRDRISDNLPEFALGCFELVKDQLPGGDNNVH